MILQGYLLSNLPHPPILGWISLNHGHIEDIGEGSPPEKPNLGGEDSLISPGFIDAHIHLPQIDAVGCDGLDLLDWLDQVIFPAEMGWCDSEIVARQIGETHARMLRSGTLGYAGYLTSHASGMEWFQKGNHDGQSIPRAWVGQVLMDRNAPPELCGHGAQPLSKLSPTDRVGFSINPRFAVSCSEELLVEAGRRANCPNTDGSLPGVQTHLAENLRECELVRELFPKDAYYTGVYDRCGLLGPRTLLAHCLHLAAEEWELIAERESVVVHCPTANTFLRSGLFDLHAARVHGVRMALGSDIAAGPDVAMPRVARAMIEVAKHRALTVDPRNPIPTPAEVWEIITRGNANALGWSNAGRLEVGADADLLLLQVPFNIDAHLYGRLIYNWRDDFITHRLLRGNLVGVDASEGISG